jgi:hypothetical protein
MLLLSRVFLFVGFSLDDVCFLSVLKEIQHDFSNCGLTHYALIRESECAKIQEKIGNLPIQLLSFRDFGDPLLQRVLSLANTVSATEPDEEAAQPDEIRTLAHTIPPTSTSEGACGQPLPSSSAIRSMVTRASYDQLAAHYLELAPDLRNNIARRLGLLPANYLSLNRVELSKQIFLAAHVQNQFAALWTAVEERHPEGKPTPNPFST